jgi:hypothetical protein
MFVVYACIFLGGSLLPLWPPFKGMSLVLGAFCAFFAGTMRTLDLTRPLWDRRDDSSCRGGTAMCPDCGNPLGFCDCADMGGSES